MPNVYSRPSSPVNRDFHSRSTQTVPNGAIHPRGIELSIGSFINETTSSTVWHQPTSNGSFIEVTKTIRQVRIPGAEYNTDPNVRDFSTTVEYSVRTILSMDPRPAPPQAAPPQAAPPQAAPHQAGSNTSGAHVQGPSRPSHTNAGVQTSAAAIDTKTTDEQPAIPRALHREDSNDDIEYIGRKSAPARGRAIVVDSDSDIVQFTRSLRKPCPATAPIARSKTSAATRVVRRTKPKRVAPISDSTDSEDIFIAGPPTVKTRAGLKTQALLERWYPRRTLFPKPSGGTFTLIDFAKMLARFRAEEEAFQLAQQNAAEGSSGPSTSSNSAQLAQQNAAESSSGPSTSSNSAESVTASAAAADHPAVPVPDSPLRTQARPELMSPFTLKRSSEDAFGEAKPAIEKLMSDKMAGKRRAVFTSCSPAKSLKRFRSEDPAF